MKKNFFITIFYLTLLITSVVTLSGCFERPEQLDPENSVEITNRFYDLHKTQEPLASTTPHIPATEIIRVPINPQRVIVFGGGDLDLFLYLGLADRVVGRAVMSGTPENVLEAFPIITLEEFKAGANGVVGVSGTEISGAPHDPVYDIIIELNPDLIIIEGRQRSGRGDSGHFQRLSMIAPTLDFGLRSGQTITDTALNLEDLAKIFPDKANVAEEAVEEINSKVAETRAFAEELEVRALMVLKNDDSYSLHGSAGRWSIVYQELGLKEAIGELSDQSHGTTMTDSLILSNANNIDAVFVIDRNDNSTTSSIIFNHPLFANTPAVQNQTIYMFDTTWYFSSGGVETLLMQVREVHSALLDISTKRG